VSSIPADLEQEENLTIKVFYSEQMSVRSNASFSPSAGKPAAAVDDWIKRGLDIDVDELVNPCDPISLTVAHDEKYVMGVLHGRSKNGFGNFSSDVRRSLYYTVGSMVTAATYAAQERHDGRIIAACSPTSGFHHAHWDRGGGFCTFNGLIVAAVAAHKRSAQKVGIIDCDYHYGDGTADILSHHGFEYADNIIHFSAGKDCRDTRHATILLRKLPDIVSEMADAGVGTILYQAGADQHVADPLGGLLTTNQLRQRDRIVFESCKKAGVSVVWNLAGGYQDPFSKVLDIHRATMEECINVYGQ